VGVIPRPAPAAPLALPSEVASDAFHYTVVNGTGRTDSRESSAARARRPDVNLLETTLLENGIRLRFAGIPGRTYRIEFSPSVSPPAWSTLGQARVQPDGTATFLGPAPVGGGGFYRTAYP
jgi:hypothetical protein